MKGSFNLRNLTNISKFTMLVAFGNIKVNLKNLDLIFELTFELTFLSAINPPILMGKL